MTVTKKWLESTSLYNFSAYYASRLIKREKHRVSDGNGFYDWSLSNWDIAKAFIELEETTELFCQGKLNKNGFIAALHLYFDVVYRETEKAWLQKWNPNLSDRPERCETLKLPIREIDFLNLRFQYWVRDEIHGFIEPDMDNHVPEEDLSHIKVGGITKDHVITWGKYKLQRYTIQGLIDRDPQWLLWAIQNTNKLPVSEEIMNEILRAQSEL